MNRFLFYLKRDRPNESRYDYNGGRSGASQKVVRGIVLVLCALAVLYMLISCSISYKFEGGSINYDLTKTINIQEFPNRASLIHPTLAQIFDQKLRDKYIEQTRLKPVDSNADIEISGEITRYDFQGMAVKEDAYTSQSKLTIAVHVIYINNKEQNQDVDQTFSAFRTIEGDGILSPETQDDLCREICEEIVDQIYNATVAKW